MRTAAYYGRRAGLMTALLFTPGCGGSGPELGPVDGTVRVNGKPVSGLRVYFNPDVEERGQPSPGRSSYGVTDEQGRFSLTYDDPDAPRPGAVVGTHVVVVNDPDAEDQTKRVQVSRVPMKYTRITETPLRKTVASGAQTIDLDLTP